MKVQQSNSSSNSKFVKDGLKLHNIHDNNMRGEEMNKSVYQADI
jgi:hypothetical protein